MTTKTVYTGTKELPVKIPRNYENLAWQWMRYSAVALIPLVWIHVALQDVIVGVHRIDLNYVQLRWAMLGWRIYDILLLAFAFAHGVNGLRQVINDYVHGDRARTVIGWVLLIGWLVISAIGAIAILSAHPTPAP